MKPEQILKELGDSVGLPCRCEACKKHWDKALDEIHIYANNKTCECKEDETTGMTKDIATTSKEGFINYKEAAMNLGKLFYRAADSDEILDEIQIERDKQGNIKYLYMTYLDEKVYKFDAFKITHYPVK